MVEFNGFIVILYCACYGRLDCTSCNAAIAVCVDIVWVEFNGFIKILYCAFMVA